MISSSAQLQGLADIGSSTNLDNLTHDISYHEELMASPQLAGVLSGDDIIDVISADHIGVRSTGYSDIYYYRIWIIERNTQLGNVTARQFRTIEVWNAYFEPQELLSYDNTGDIIVDGFEAGTFNPLQSRLYSVEIPLEGTPTIDAIITWVFETLGDRVGTVQGQRIIPFTLRHNWEEKVLEQISYKTEVLIGMSGKEQRIGQRDTARRRLEMSYLTLTPLERSYLENVLYGWQGRRYAVPVWSDVTPLRTAVTTGGSTFDVDTVTRDFEVGSLLFVTDGVNHDTLEITAVTADLVTTDSGSLNDYAVGAKVVPARLGMLESTLGLSRITNELESITLAWAIGANEPSTNRLVDYTPELYRGIEVYNLSNDYSDSIGIEQELRQDILDNSIGTFNTYGIDPFPRRTYPFKELRTRDDLGEFFQWIENRKGSLNPFWFTERVPSFFLQEDILSSDTTLIVKTGGYTAQSFDSVARRDIAIKTSDGWKYRRITGSVMGEDGNETITLDTSLGVDLTVAENPLMSYLKFVRLAQDSVELIYESTGVVTTASSFIDLLTNN
jgi:hypothetical protein